MRNPHNLRTVRRLIIFCAVICALVALPMLSRAQSATSVNIVNNSGRSVIHVYLSHVNADDWSGNQLGDATISPGQSFNLGNVACDAQQVKVIAEDQNGCFLSTVVNCGDNATWTITNDTAADCGG